MYTHRNFHLLFGIILSFGLFACASPAKLAESGDYDAAIERAVNKLAGKKNKKSKDVEALEFAFAKANAESLRRIEDMKADGRESLWPSILQEIDRIDRRQSIVDPLVPLYAENGYTADFKFVRIGKIRPEAVERTTAYYYNKGVNLLEQGRKGDKQAAQYAYYAFQDAADYQPQYKNLQNLRAEARDLGITHIAIAFENRSNMFVPDRFAEDLLRVSTNDLNENWKRYHSSPAADMPVDFTVLVQLDHIAFQPEFVKEREYHLEREIIDHYRVKKDRDGNPILDSLGNEIKVPVKKMVHADVIEVFKSKAAMVEGSLEFYDNRTKSLIDVQSIGAEVVFENAAAIYRGDKRALTNEVKDLVDNPSLPFPTDGAMIMQASDRLRPVLCDRIRSFRWLI
ncbi:MAG: hypothetical protein GYB31_08490 [Bacteroidetes bacterium]|nr:hypothetical protein [Bacteroidota bacterium]